MMDESTLISSPILYVTGLVQGVTDQELLQVLSECLKLRLNLNRDNSLPAQAPLNGTIEFESISKAEQAFATCNHQTFSSHRCVLLLSPSPSPSTPNPIPSAQARLLKSLPLHYTSSKIYQLCRPFGPIHSCTLQLSPSFPPGGPPKFKGLALVRFYKEGDAKEMEEGLNFVEVERGASLVVQKWDDRRGKKARVRAERGTGRRSEVGVTTSSSNGNGRSILEKEERTSQWANSRYSTTTSTSLGLNAGAPDFASSTMSRNVSGNSMWSNGTGETSFEEEKEDQVTEGSQAAGSLAGTSSRKVQQREGEGIDPCNLFIKSLPSTYTSSSLSTLFSPYGSIVSALVVTDPQTQRSKEFGFVSFRTSEEARNALEGIDGRLVEGRKVTVRLHEPKKVREGRLSGGIEGLTEGFRELKTSTIASPSVSSSPDRTTHVKSEASFTSPSLSEHDRLVSAVQVIDAQRANEIVELIEGLPRKERVMCLFNPEVLRQKVQDALLVLEAMNEEPESRPVSSPIATPSLVSTSQPFSPSSIPSSIPLLARLPASQIVPLLPLATSTLSLSRPSPADLAQTKEFMNSLLGSPPSQIKQKLGEKLFKVIKSTGVKRAPKITIDLLDTEELDSLSVLVHYPEILKEKALLLTNNNQAK